MTDVLYFYFAALYMLIILLLQDFAPPPPPSPIFKSFSAPETPSFICIWVGMH